MQDQLGFPDKADTRAAAGTGWTPAELNHILNAHVVDSALTTFGCVRAADAHKRAAARTQACGRAETGLQDGSSLMRSKGWYIEVYRMMRMLYGMMSMLFTQSIS